MSSLGTKLRRLGGAGLAPAPQAAASQSDPNESRPILPTSPRQDTLERLRQTIARIVAKDGPAPPPPQKPCTGDLPFVAQDTPHGVLYVRHLPFDRQHRVGRYPLHLARQPDTTMLSLLALDPALTGVDMRRALYLDTETTGLAGGTGTLPFLIGLGWFTEDGPCMVEQLLLRRPGEEAPILARVLDRLRASSIIVTFNGKAFDLPLVRTRFVMNRMPAPPPLPHLDLLHLARRIHKQRIGGCSLGSIESHVLGFGRVDDVPSGEVSARYFHFLRTGDEGALLGVVAHNVWDIVSMVALVGLYGEPLDGMSGQDLAGVAATVHRARCPDRAAELAEEAVARGGGTPALRTRASLAKARGDRDRALADFELLVRDIDDPGVRLELAKLYEHHRRAPRDALQVVELGVAESPGAAEHRRSRLVRKIDRETQEQLRKTRATEGQTTLPGMRVPARKARGRGREA